MSSIKSKLQASNNAEFQNTIRVLNPIFLDATATVQDKRSAINSVVNELSDETFSKDFVVDIIISWINVKEDISKQFADVDSQVQSILAWLPRMAEHKDKLEKYVKKYRKQFGLKL